MTPHGGGVAHEPEVRVLIVDDHPLMRRAIRETLRSAPRVLVVADAAGAADALDVLGRDAVDVVIVDLSLGGVDGFELIQRIGERHPRVRALAFSMHASSTHARPAYEAGAAGYVSKTEESEVLIEAIGKVARGEWAFAPGLIEGPAPDGLRSLGPAR